MAQNFKKLTGGPTPILPSGSQHFGGKTTTTTPTKHPHGQDPHQAKKPKGARDSNAKHPHSPPDTPHQVHAGGALMTPVSSAIGMNSTGETMPRVG